MFPAADGVTGHPEHYQDDANHQHNDADRPDDGNLRDEPDNQQDETEVQWNTGAKETTRGSLSWRKENSASDWDR